MLEAIRTFFLPSELKVILYVVSFILAVVVYLWALSAIPAWLSGAKKKPLAPEVLPEKEKDDDIPLNTFSRVVLGLFFLGFIALGFYFYKDFFREVGRRVNTDRLTATITDVQYTDGHENDGAIGKFIRRTYFLNVTYTYQVNGSPYTGVEHICYDSSVGRRKGSRCEYFLPRVRDTHEIYVSRTNPQTSHFPRVFLSDGLIGSVILAVAIFLFPFIRNGCFPKKRV